MKLAQLEEKIRRTSIRGDGRHRRIDDELAAMKATREQLVAAFNGRLEQIDGNVASIAANLARIQTLETEVAKLRDALGVHMAEQTGRAHRAS